MGVLDDLGFYKNIFGSLPIPIFVAEAESGKVIDVNNEACKLVEMAFNEIINLNQNQLHPPIKNNTILESIITYEKALENTKEIPPFEHVIFNSSGEHVPVEINSSLIDLNDRKLIVSIIKDLRTQKFHENILSYYDKALEKSSSLLAFVDLDYTYKSVNETYFKMFKIPKSEIVGKKVYEIVGEDYFNNTVKKYLDQALLGIPTEYESILEKDGKKFYLKAHYEPYYSLEKKIIGIVASVHDLTKFKEYELESIKKEKLLIHQSKMAAMGEMLENIAHQWRQPLSLISTYTSGVLLHKEFGTLRDEVLEESLNSIMDTTAYLSNTIDDFKNFFEKDKLKTNFALQGVVNKTIDLVESSLKANEIDINRNFEEEISLFSYKNEFMQVLLNIINNSKDALLSNNKLENKKRVIVISTYKDLENNSVIEIKDNAGGIDPEIIDKIFEPYFTTKHQSQGTGIGLFMTRQIITNHMKGEIEVKNIDFEVNKEIYKGALFKIIFS